MSYQEKCCIVWYETNLFIPGQLKGHFKGFSGGIRCISCLDKQQMVVSCGLDKFLRVHHLHNRKLLHKVGLSCSWQILCFSSDEKCTVYFGGLQFAICGLFYVCREVFLRIKNFSFLVCIYSFIFFGNWACETPIVRGFWFTLLTIEKSSVYVFLFCLSASRTMVCLLSLTCNKIFSPGGVSGLPYLQSSRNIIFGFMVSSTSPFKSLF